MASATAACMAGTDPAKIWQLPDTTGLKHEVIMHGGRSAFDNAIRLAGAKLVLARTDDEVRGAINEKTAMIYTTSLGSRLEKIIAIAKPLGQPLIVTRQQDCSNVLRDAHFGHAERRQIVLRRLCALGAEGQIVFSRAAIVAMSFDLRRG